MWWNKFYNIITNPLSPQEVRELMRLNPDRFYVEEIRSLLGVSSSRARKICEIAVRQGVFGRGVEVLAPDGAVVASSDQESKLPENVRLWMDHDGEYEETEVATRLLPKRLFYRLMDDDTSATKTHAQAS